MEPKGKLASFSIVFIASYILVTFWPRKHVFTRLHPKYAQQKQIPQEVAVVLQLPEYYIDNVVFQWGPGSHTIWGFSSNPNFTVQVREICQEYVSFGQTSNFVYHPNELAYLWEVKIPPLNNHKFDCALEITQANQIKTVKNVHFGEVWILIGQSNLWLPLNQAENSTLEMKTALNYNNIFLFTNHDVEESIKPLHRLIYNNPQWIKLKQLAKVISNASNISSLGLFFAEYLSDLLKQHKGIRPAIGIIQAYAGNLGVEHLATPWSVDQCYTPGIIKRRPLYGKDRVPFSTMYNSLVHPFIRHSLKGVLWYQGETNSRALNSTYHNYGHYSCMMSHLVEGYRRVWRNHGQQLVFGIVQLSPIKDNPSYHFTLHMTRWKQTCEVGYLPNEYLPNTFLTVTHDFWGHSADVHEPNKQRVAHRAVLGAANMAYGLKQYPLNGPFPGWIKADNGSLVIKYQTDFEYSNETSNSGFFYCCHDCDYYDSEWSPFPKSLVQANVGARSITLSKVYIGFCIGGFPSWVGYAFHSLPFQKDYDAPLYSSDRFRLPGPMWRCRLHAKGCDWQRAEQWN